MISCSQRWGRYRFWCGAYLVAALAGLLLTVCLIYVTGWVTFNLAFKLALVAWTPYLLTAPLVWRLAQRFPLERAVWWRHLWIHLPATVAFIALAEALQFGVAATVLELPPPQFGRNFDSPPIHRIDKLEPLPLPSPEYRSRKPPMLGRMAPMRAQFNIPIYWLIVSVAHLAAYSTRLRQREQQQALLQGELTQARLQALQTQLQPHFLFNTLNAISALIREQPRAAEEMVANLSDLLRVTLDQTQEAETTLEHELLVLGYYLDIQLVRFGRRLRIEQSVPADVLDGLVPAFILQPLVENAIEHGIGHAESGFIRLEARLVEDRLQIQVCDSGCGGAPDQVSKLPDGIGLGNTRTRLRTLYGIHHRFELFRAPSGGFCVELEIPFHLSPMLPNAIPVGSQTMVE